MADDVKAAIADALTGAPLLGKGQVFPSEAYKLAEAAHDAAVEAGMAPAAEVDNLRRVRDILLEVIYEELDEQDASGEDGRVGPVMAVARHGDVSRLPEHISRVWADAPHDDCECGGSGQAALDGDDQQEPKCGARRYEPRNDPGRPPDPPAATCDLPAGHDGDHRGPSIAGKRRVSWAALDGDR